MDFEQARLNIMQQKEMRLNKQHEQEKKRMEQEQKVMEQQQKKYGTTTTTKLNMTLLSKRCDLIQRQKMRVDYLESLCQNTTIDATQQQKYADLLNEAREKYLDLLT
jgi:hypothetical protein